MDLLTIRRLPVYSKPDDASVYKQRIDRNLLRMVTEQVAAKHTKVRVSKRFALEWVCLRFLDDEGLLNSPVQIPEIQ